MLIVTLAVGSQLEFTWGKKSQPLQYVYVMNVCIQSFKFLGLIFPTVSPHSFCTPAPHCWLSIKPKIFPLIYDRFSKISSTFLMTRKNLLNSYYTVVVKIINKQLAKFKEDTS